MIHDLVLTNITPDIVIDCGANRGYWFLESKEVWPDAEYLLIEANQECEQYLKELRLQYHMMKRLDYIIGCLGEEPNKEVTFYTLRDCPCATGASVYRETTDFFKGENAVEHKRHTQTLDKVCSQIDFSGKKSLLKIDAQGSELDILKGGRIVLEHCDGLIVEVANTEYNLGAPLRKEVESYVESLGFTNMGEIDTLVHPITREEIQNDLFFLRR